MSKREGEENMPLDVTCGNKRCAYYEKGICLHNRIALDETGHCMRYFPSMEELQQWNKEITAKREAERKKQERRA